MHAHTKYKPYPSVQMDTREWPHKQLIQAPVWVSTDLRDGNQALASPMGIEQKIAYFKALVHLGFKEIEVAYPCASRTEFSFCRRLIEEGMIPEDVTIGVLTPSIPKHIETSFRALEGARSMIMHLYNPTAENQREVVFGRSQQGIIDLALLGTESIKACAKSFSGEVVFEYSPESFSQTELSFAREISNAVIGCWEPTPESKMILNLPNTLEACTPNIYADRIEWMSRQISNREGVILSIHPHNDRGTAVASAEMAMLAGAERVEGTLLGNGERAGNVDLLTLAFNLYSQGVDPRLNLSVIDEVLGEICPILGQKVSPRHPYIGEMIYTAFSGTHQDAIKKGMEYHRKSGSTYWEVPYLPIDPTDIQRSYHDAVRINSQSGKGGVAYVLKEVYGIDVPKELLREVAEEVQKIAEQRDGELSSDEILGIYEGIAHVQRAAD